jgi:hypothetical protein
VAAPVDRRTFLARSALCALAAARPKLSARIAGAPVAGRALDARRARTYEALVGALAEPGSHPSYPRLAGKRFGEWYEQKPAHARAAVNATLDGLERAGGGFSSLPLPERRRLLGARPGAEALDLAGVPSLDEGMRVPAALV